MISSVTVVGMLGRNGERRVFERLSERGVATYVARMFEEVETRLEHMFGTSVREPYAAAIDDSAAPRSDSPTPRPLTCTDSRNSRRKW